jgi:hypothetical protein
MSEKDWISLVISGMALAVAIYGILERGLATRRALRIRLTELIDGLAKIDVDQQLYVQDASKSDAMKSAFRTSHATRRALLAAQAIDILAKYRRRMTIPEYITLGTALHETSDSASERSVRAQAVANLRKETPFQRAAAWRAWAWFNFEQGDVETARQAIRRSLEAMLPSDDVGKLERFEHLLSWFEYELQRSATSVANASPILDEAEELLTTVNYDAWRLDGIGRVRTERERLVIRTAK